MERRDVLGASSIVLATVAAGCVTNAFDDVGERSGPTTNGDSGASTGEMGIQSTHDGGTVIEVRADGIVETDPDQATLSVAVEARGDSAEAVTDALAEGIADLRATVTDLGIPDEHIESGRYDVRRAREGTGYEGTHSLAITLDDVRRVGEVIDAATGAGADDVGGVHFGLQDETQAELRKQAIEQALANADAEAEYVAENRDVQLTGTRSVSTTNADVVPVEATVGEMEAADDAAAPPTELDAGPVTVSASVVVTYGFE